MYYWYSYHFQCSSYLCVDLYFHLASWSFCLKNCFNNLCSVSLLTIHFFSASDIWKCLNITFFLKDVLLGIYSRLTVLLLSALKLLLYYLLNCIFPTRNLLLSWSLALSTIHVYFLSCLWNFSLSPVFRNLIMC